MHELSFPKNIFYNDDDMFLIETKAKFIVQHIQLHIYFLQMADLGYGQSLNMIFH